MGFKKKDKFNMLLGIIATNLKESTNYFTSFPFHNGNELKAFTEKMKTYEVKGDTYTHDVIKNLNKAFITPIEREDILSLAMSLDDVLDSLEHCSALLEMYSIIKIDAYMLKFVDAIRNCAIEIEKAIELLSTNKLLQISEHVRKIKEYESQCDEILRLSIKYLFTVEKNPIRIIQYKEIYENLESITDYCQNVANTLEIIIMKNV